MIEDKVNIGLSLEASKIADILEASDYFEDRLSIAKFALAHAIKSNLDTNIEGHNLGEGGGTKWNIGSVDNDHYLKNLIISLYPEQNTPYRLIELLMNQGLLSIGKVISETGIKRISELM